MTHRTVAISTDFDACWMPRARQHSKDSKEPLTTACLKRKTNRLIAIGLVAAGIVSSCSANADSGRALDWATNEPVAGARMTLDCSRYKLIGLEGTTHLRTVTNVTDAEGRYSFWHLDLLGCSLVTFGGEKEGYSGSLPGSAIEKPNIPTLVYMIKTSDRVLFDIQSITPAGGIKVLKNSVWQPCPQCDYDDFFGAFFKAKRMATTPREIAFVHEHYCDRLAGLYAQFTDEYKASLTKYAIDFNYAGKSARGMMSDYPAEVVPYCAKP
jgi:hypothetical protein